MQQQELLLVASILWGGILIFLLYLFIRMLRLESTMKRLTQNMDGENY
ncbi:MAG: hypothetical protein KAR33_05425 [Candidatus Thorarchaeota archaeon]|nr:hypothetical protein [Candidatus Thorarchaeota archaeon]